MLAVSGGRDSMVLLDAAARLAPELVAGVATFDHATGPAATAAADLVEDVARRLGFPVVRGRAAHALRGEAAWRRARRAFLRRAALDRGAAVATAHTRDDQIETVLMRELRHAGARGLAALLAPSDIVRPMLEVSRAEVAAYALEHGVRWVDDPSNESRAYLRNRVRHDLLPALAGARPTLPDELLALSRQAAELRGEVDDFVEREIRPSTGEEGVSVARSRLAGYDPRDLALLWPAIAARAGVALDWRGTRRITLFSIQARAGGRIQLAGGVEVVLHRGAFHLRRRPAERPTAWGPRELVGSVAVPGWSFRPGVQRSGALDVGLWSAELPRDRALSVRPWRPGDRMVPAGSAGPRRVKGLLRDAGVDAASREGWPVVVAGEEIVWVPGVRRGAVAARSDRPVLVYHCQRLHHRDDSDDAHDLVP